MPAPTAREMLGAKPSTASPSDSTLIIIDAQGEYAEGHLKVSDTAPRKAIEGLLKTYREAGATSNIVHVLHQEDDGAPVFTPGTKLAEEFEELKPKGEEKVVGKKHPGSFSGTDLEQHLKSLGDKGKKVVLTGYMAHGVSTTARQAAELGLDVLLAEDAIGDRDVGDMTGAQLTKTTMVELGDFFGSVVQSRDIK